MQYIKNFQQIQINHLEDSDFDIESPIQILVKLKEEDSIKLANKVLAFWQDQGKCGNGDLDVFSYEEDSENEITRVFLERSQVVRFSVGRYCDEIDFPFAEIILEGQVDCDSNGVIVLVIKDLLNWLDQHLMN